jgi:hypothetical protein
MSTPTHANGRPESIFKHSKFKFVADPLPDAKSNQYSGKPQEPTAEFVPINNEWHIKVYTNSTSDVKNNGVIEAKMDGDTFFAFFASLSKLGDAVFNKILTGATEFDGLNALVIDNRGFSFQGGKRSDKAHTLSKTHIGVDDRGIYFSVRSTGRPEINFYCAGGEYHSIKGRVGKTAMDGGHLESALYALGISEAYLNIASQINKDHYITWPELKAVKEQNKQRFQGGAQQGGRGGYTGQPKPQQNYAPAPQQNANQGLFDDDIPM